MHPTTSQTKGLSRIRCRQIVAADLEKVADLLTAGFRPQCLWRIVTQAFRAPNRPFWVRALKRLSAHPGPAAFPKYGYMLEVDGRPVGVILLIFTSLCAPEAEARIRCSVSSWYVAPAYRSYASMLVSHALRHKDVTYFNITPNLGTLGILEAQGYTRYGSGTFLSVPALSPHSAIATEIVAGGVSATRTLGAAEAKLLRDHADYGCISLICKSQAHYEPFVFLPLRRKGLVPFAYLAYCRSIDGFVRFSRSVGRHLARRGFLFVAVDANGPVEGLVGRYSADVPKYFRGPDRPRLGDFAYSERVMFGF